MNVDRFVMLFAGTLVVVSVVLSYLFSPWWMLLALFVGANLMQASVTGFCPLAIVLRALGTKPGAAFPT